MPDESSTPVTTDPASATATPEPTAPPVPTTTQTTPTPEVVYDIEVPDGVKLDPAPYKEYAKSLGLTPEQAQKVLDADAKRITEYEQSVAKREQEWTKAIGEDKTIDNKLVTSGKGYLGKTLPGLDKLITESKHDKHPDVVRLLNVLGKLINTTNANVGHVQGQSNQVNTNSLSLVDYYANKQGS